MKIVMTILIALVPFTAAMAQEGSSPSGLYCGRDYTWRMESCNYPNDHPPCFAQIQESTCTTQLNKYTACEEQPGIQCCGHNDPITGKPYLQADYVACSNTPTAPAGMVEASRKYGRKVYLPSCQGGYVPSAEKPEAASRGVGL